MEIQITTTFPTCDLPDYVLRPAVESDVDSIVDLDRSNMKLSIDRYYPGSWDDDETRLIVVENLERARVVEISGDIVACYYWWIEGSNIAFLHSIQVAEAHRNKGLGNWLMTCFETEARALGLKKAGLTVFNDNPAIGLYKRLGYTVTGEDGPSAIEMEKSLEGVKHGNTNNHTRSSPKGR